jgi:hypothetical protein
MIISFIPIAIKKYEVISLRNMGWVKLPITKDQKVIKKKILISVLVISATISQG